MALKEPDMNNPQLQLGVGLQQPFSALKELNITLYHALSGLKILVMTYPQLALGVIQITPLRG
jgi:hypothetical protein